MVVCIQPDAFNEVAVYEPLVVYVMPFADQVYELQAVSLTEDMVPVSMVKSNVTVLVHPAAFNDVAVYAPLNVYDIPFRGHVYASQAVADTLDEVLWSIVNTNV